MEAGSGRSVTVAKHVVAVELDCDSSISLNIYSQTILPVVRDDVLIDQEVDSVTNGVLGENIKSVTQVIGRTVLSRRSHYSKKHLLNAQMESVATTVQEGVVCDLQILNSSSLCELEEQTVSFIPLIVDANHVPIDNRLLQHRYRFHRQIIAFHANHNAVTGIRGRRIIIIL